MRRPAVTVIVPVYNEEARIVPSVTALAIWMGSHPGPWELVIVDDGSTDSTPELLAPLAHRLRVLRILRLPRNRGKGGAVRAGMKAARGKAVVFMDADLSTAPAEIPAALRALRTGADLAIGSRYLPGSRVPVPQPLPRRLAGRLFNMAVRVVLGLRYADTQCGFKAMTAGTAHLLARSMRIEDFSFDVELLLLARRAGLKTVEFPITWRDRAHSTVRLMTHSLRMFWTVFGLRRRFRSEAGYHPVMSLPLILTSVALAICGQIMMKHGANSLADSRIGWGFLHAIVVNPFVWGGLSCYGLSAVTWLAALARVDLSFAFPMLSLGFVATAVYSWWKFGEVMSVNRVLGIGLVVAGVFVIAISGAPEGSRERTR